jgi:hypothetical protein
VDLAADDTKLTDHHEYVGTDQRVYCTRLLQNTEESYDMNKTKYFKGTRVAREKKHINCSQIHKTWLCTGPAVAAARELGEGTLMLM